MGDGTHVNGKRFYVPTAVACVTTQNAEHAMIRLQATNTSALPPRLAKKEGHTTKAKTTHPVTSTRTCQETAVWLLD